MKKKVLVIVICGKYAAEAELMKRIRSFIYIIGDDSHH